MSAAGVSAAEIVGEKTRSGYVRWIICALLFLATTINYIDRQVLGILAPTLQHDIGWNEVQYGYIVTAFQAAYAIGLLIVGRVLDVVGTKLGFAFALIFWSFAAMAHALARTPLGFAFARFGLGLGEAGNFPAAIKTVAEWFPKRERAFATGVFNSGSNVGAIVAPAIVPWIALTLGWQWAFIITGAIGFAWLILWWLLYETPERHPRLTASELSYIRSDPQEAVTKISWVRLAALRQTWAFAIGKFMTDPIWWFYLYWIPKFLNEKHGLTLSKLGPPLITIYVVADIGSIGGGWLSSRLIKSGWTINAARKSAMLVCA
ncbi:MAG TPA: MFS transporter, partial [Thermoanaerobaculia bacterium]